MRRGLASRCIRGDTRPINGARASRRRCDLAVPYGFPMPYQGTVKIDKPPKPVILRHRLAAWIHLAHERLSALEGADRQMTAAGLDTRFRVNLARQGRDAEWAVAAATRTGILTRGHLWAVDNATYLAVVVLAQIEKTRKLLPEDNIPAYPDHRDVQLWRNVIEHWEDEEGPSLTKLLQSEPRFDSSILRYGGSVTTIGHLSADQVRAWLDMVLDAIEQASMRESQVLPRAEDSVYAERPGTEPEL